MLLATRLPGLSLPKIIALLPFLNLNFTPDRSPTEKTHSVLPSAEAVFRHQTGASQRRGTDILGNQNQKLLLEAASTLGSEYWVSFLLRTFL